MANPGNIFIDVLAARSWLDVGGDRNITYYFDETSPAHLWSGFEKNIFRSVLQEWANVANITFQEVFSPTGADLFETWVTPAVMTQIWGPAPGGTWPAAHYIPQAGGIAGHWNSNRLGSIYSQSELQPGNDGYRVMVHEIGHALGLTHSHGSVQTPGNPIFPGLREYPDGALDPGDFGYNQMIYTIMSYNTGPHVTQYLRYGMPATPMAFDIAAIQFLYGPNTTFRSGSNDGYGLPDENAPGTYWQCIWDTGGTDTIGYDGKKNATIDLRPASLIFGDPIAGGAISKADGIFGGFTIANGVVIENAVGGSGNDTLVGNSADNAIDGRAGDDSVVYAGPRSAYTVTDLGGGRVRVAGPDGTDTISNVERLVFSDATLIGPFASDPPRAAPSPSAEAAGVADYNGDGKADILWQHDNGTGAVWLMDGTSAAAFGSALPNSGTAWHERAGADFNADGRADILWQNDSGAAAIWLMDGTNVTAFGAQLPNPGPAWHAREAADFNADGRADILWQNDNGAAAVWLMDGTNPIAFGTALPNPGTAWHVKAGADFNGDGKADILWQHDNGAAAVWLMDGTSAIAFGDALPNPGASWHVREAGDCNGDGRADIVWQHDDGTAAVWLMNGTSVLSFGDALPNPGSAWHVV